MSKINSKIIVQSALVCEDVRVEQNGKSMLIGVYTSDIGVLQFPIRMSLCAWIQLCSQIAGDVQIGIRALIPKEVQVFNMTGTAHFQQEKIISAIATPKFAFDIQQEGDFLIQLSENDGEWRDIISLPILKRSSSNIDQLNPDQSTS